MNRYLDFTRLATRSEYWAVLIIASLSTFLVSFVGAAFLLGDGVMAVFGGLFMLAASVLLLWITLSTAASRCRDAGINPWWAASMLIPYIGFVTMIVFGCLESRQPDPQE